MTKCPKENCKRLVICKGLCSLHYQRLYNEINRNKINEKAKIKWHQIIKTPEIMNRMKINSKRHYQSNKEKILNRMRNNPKRKEYVKQYNKNHPEVNLKGKIKQLSKLSIKLMMNTFEYRTALISWGRSIRKRDNYTCQICGKRDEKNSIAHHILYKNKYPELSLNLNNGITLCKECHKLVHIIDMKSRWKIGKT